MDNHLDLASVLHDAGALLPDDMDLQEPVVKTVVAGDIAALRTLFSFGPSKRILRNDSHEDPPLMIEAIRSLSWIMDGDKPDDEDFLKPFTKPEERASPAGAPERYCAVVKFLLDAGCDPDAADESGSTALLESLERECSETIFEALVQHGSNVHASRRDGTNALHVAGATGNIHYLETLLSLGLDVNKITVQGNTPVVVAAANGHEQAVRMLLDHPSIDSQLKAEQNWLQLAQCYNAIKTQDLALFRTTTSGTNLPLHLTDHRGQTLLHLAAASAIPEEAVLTLLSHGAATTAQDLRGDTPLHVASASKSPDVAIIAALLATSSSSHVHDGRGHTTGSGSVIKSRNFPGTSYGINRTPQDATALHLAAYAGNADVVRALLGHAVAELGDMEALGKGKGPAGQSARNKTVAPADPISPLRSATSSRSSSTSSGSRQAPYGNSKADPEPGLQPQPQPPFIDWSSDSCGRTALMSAVQSGDVDTVRCLLEMGADVNARGGRGSWGFCALDLALLVERRTGRGSGGGGSGSDGESGSGSESGSDEDGEMEIAPAVDSAKGGIEESEMVALLKGYGAVVFDW